MSRYSRMPLKEFHVGTVLSHVACLGSAAFALIQYSLYKKQLVAPQPAAQTAAGQIRFSRNFGPRGSFHIGNVQTDRAKSRDVICNNHLLDHLVLSLANPCATVAFAFGGKKEATS